MFKLEIETENHAFYHHTSEDGYEPGPEISRILREIATHCERQCIPPGERNVYDSNGNHVGTWTLTP